MGNQSYVGRDKDSACHCSTFAAAKKTNQIVLYIFMCLDKNGIFLLDVCGELLCTLTPLHQHVIWVKDQQNKLLVLTHLSMVGQVWICAFRMKIPFFFPAPTW